MRMYKLQQCLVPFLGSRHVGRWGSCGLYIFIWLSSTLAGMAFVLG